MDGRSSNGRRVTFSTSNVVHILPRAEDTNAPASETLSSSSPASTAVAAAEDLSTYSAADLRILKSDRREMRVAAKSALLLSNKFDGEHERYTSSAASTENADETDPNSVRGEIEGGVLPDANDFGYTVEAFNLSEERNSGLLRAARNGHIAGRGNDDDDDHRDDAWLLDNAVMDPEKVKRLHEARRKQAQNDAMSRQLDANGTTSIEHALRQVLQFLEPGESVLAALRRLRPSSSESTGKGGILTGTMRKASWRDRMRQTKLARQAAATITRGTSGKKNPSLPSAPETPFSSLTKFANVLMDQGFDKIYTETRDELAARLHGEKGHGLRVDDSEDGLEGSDLNVSSRQKRQASTFEEHGSATKKRRIDGHPTECVWYYKRSLEDSQEHGPFSTLQMKGWREQGYFIGNHTVKLRRDPPLGKSENTGSAGDAANDLLDDLEGDDNDISDFTREWVDSSTISF